MGGCDFGCSFSGYDEVLGGSGEGYIEQVEVVECFLEVFFLIVGFEDCALHLFS